jgi:hypothetical protein
MKVSTAVSLIMVAMAGGCVTSTTLRPEVQGLNAVALVSLHGSSDLGIVDSLPGPMAVGDEIGEDVVELLEGDTELFLEGLFCDGHVLAPVRAMVSKKYDLVPEALPAEDWSQANKMLAVDVTDERTPEALATLTRDLDVDASVVIRHEWWMSRERYELVRMADLYDRCTILVVDRDGVVLWRQVVVSRLPARTLWGVQLQFGLNGADTVGEARSLARETARLAYAELASAFRALPQNPPSTAVRTRTPPPPLEPPAQPQAPPAL